MPPTPKDLSLEELLLLSWLRWVMASGEGRRIRDEAGVSQAEMGSASDNTVPGISKWESGQRCPTGAGAIRYAPAAGDRRSP
jgi:DNA-binding transcriptional regulator YiaG